MIGASFIMHRITAFLLLALSLAGSALAGGPSFVYTANSDSVLRVDLATGDRTEVSGPLVGTGTAFQEISSLIFRDEDTLYVMDSGPNSVGDLFIVDLATGNRTPISRADDGNGPSFFWAKGLDESGGQLLFCSEAPTCLMSINPSTGTRTIISSSSVGTGTMASDFLDVKIVGTSAYVATGSLSQILQVDLATGNRSTFASNSIGTGPSLPRIEGLHIESDGDFVIVTGNRMLAHYNPTTQTRSIVSDSNGVGVGTGPAWAFDRWIAALPDGNYLVGDLFDDTAIMHVDAISGNRTIVSSPTQGAGVTLEPVAFRPLLLPVAAPLSADNWQLYE